MKWRMHRVHRCAGQRMQRAACSVAIAIAIVCTGGYAQAPDQPAQAAKSGGSAPAASAVTPQEYAKKMTLRGVPGFAQVTPTLYRGEQPSEKGFENLAKMGVQIVVDLRLSRRGAERKQVTALGMQYVSLPWFCMRPKDETFAKFLQLIRDNPGKKVFVHCRTGDDRAGMDIAAYRMVEQGWTSEEAAKEMHALGADWLHRRICIGLGSYEAKFPERYRSHSAFEQLRDAKTNSTATQSSFATPSVEPATALQ